MKKAPSGPAGLMGFDALRNDLARDISHRPDRAGVGKNGEDRYVAHATSLATRAGCGNP